MAERIKKSERLPEDRPAALGELIHAQVRVAIETAVHEELAIALGAGRYERHDARRGYRNGVKLRTLMGPTGPLALTLPRATLGAPGREWRSTLVPRYQRADFANLCRQFEDSAHGFTTLNSTTAMPLGTPERLAPNQFRQYV